jgi:hypothetical protein
MIITKYKNRTKYTNIVDNYDLFVPDQFAPEKDKLSADWIKSAMDYYANIAYSQYWSNHTLKKNYDLLNGILIKEDYFTPDYEKLVEFLDEATSVEIPDYIKHYPMMNPPLNTLIGEITKRPDNVRFKAIDEHSNNDFMREQTESLTNALKQKIQEVMMARANKAGLLEQREQLVTQAQTLKQSLDQIQASGVDMKSPETTPELEQIAQQMQQIEQQLQQVESQIKELSPKELEGYLNKTYQSTAEQWANLKLQQLKIEFDVKSKSEDGFRDFLITAREYHHIYLDKSKSGLNYEVLNPVKTWLLTEPDPKFTTDCYAIGYIESMEMSKILDRFSLTEEEIEYLREHRDDYVKNPNADVNIFESGKTGYDSVFYPQHDPLRTQYEATVRAELEQHALLDTYDPSGERYYPYGYMGYDTRNHRYTVVISYFKSKRKIGKLTYIDDEGFEQIEIIDDNFEYDKNDPTILDIEWEYKNEWWRGVRIGQAVYLMEPLRYTELPPIVGVFQYSKNTIPKSLVDQMKVYQIIYNICLNQIYLLLEKEVGVAVLYNLRQLPRYKDLTDEDALEKMTTLAKEAGVLGIDDSPENTKGQSTFNQYTRLDLTRTQEIQSRISLATWAKSQCWELLGFTPQRLGSVAATETATGINQSLSQSFSQTEPITALHEQCLNLVYQQLIDTAQYLDSQKDVSTITFVNSDMHNEFLTINGNDLKTRDLQVYVTNRAEDKRKLEEIRQLSMAYAQNQLHPYYSTIINTSQSVSEIREFLKEDMQKKEAQQAEQQQMQQKQLDQQKQLAEQQMQLAEQRAEQDRQFKAQQSELDRKKDVVVAQIRAASSPSDVNVNQVPDALEVEKFNSSYTKMIKELDLKQQDLENRRTTTDREFKIKEAELKLKEKEIQSKENIAKMKSETELKNPVVGEE